MNVKPITVKVTQLLKDGRVFEGTTAGKIVKSFRQLEVTPEAYKMNVSGLFSTKTIMSGDEMILNSYKFKSVNDLGESISNYSINSMTQTDTYVKTIFDADKKPLMKIVAKCKTAESPMGNITQLDECSFEQFLEKAKSYFITYFDKEGKVRDCAKIINPDKLGTDIITKHYIKDGQKTKLSLRKIIKSLLNTEMLNDDKPEALTVIRKLLENSSIARLGIKRGFDPQIEIFKKSTVFNKNIPGLKEMRQVYELPFVNINSSKKIDMITRKFENGERTYLRNFTNDTMKVITKRFDENGNLSEKVVDFVDDYVDYNQKPSLALIELFDDMAEKSRESITAQFKDGKVVHVTTKEVDWLGNEKSIPWSKKLRGRFGIGGKQKNYAELK